MTTSRPRVVLACNRRVYEDYFRPADRDALGAFADWDWVPLEGGGHFGPNDDPAARATLAARLGAADGLIVCHGAPRIDAELLAAAPRLTLVGELEGDRFAERIDLDAAWARGVRVVDTTHGSSYPVAEWALALILMGLRNGGAHFRRTIQHEVYRDPQTGWLPSRLQGKRVGLIGGGHIARRLIGYLAPFECDIRVHDPYLPTIVAEVMGFLLTSLDYVLAESDVVVCVAPLTPGTRRMIGARELELLRPGTVFVNVSRGAIVDPDALIARLGRGDITAGLDVFDPEPIPADSPIKDLPNVFLSPHIAGTNRGLESFCALMVGELDRHFHGHQTLYDLTPRTRANRTGAAPPADGLR